MHMHIHTHPYVYTHPYTYTYILHSARKLHTIYSVFTFGVPTPRVPKQLV